jgi:hypothetical protein
VVRELLSRLLYCVYQFKRPVRNAVRFDHELLDRDLTFVHAHPVSDDITVFGDAMAARRVRSEVAVSVLSNLYASGRPSALSPL